MLYLKPDLLQEALRELTQELWKDSPKCDSESLKNDHGCYMSKDGWLTTWTLKQPFYKVRSYPRNVYIRPPQEAQSKGSWKSGLENASLYFYNRVKDTTRQSEGTARVRSRPSSVLLVGWLQHCDRSPCLSRGWLYLGRFWNVLQVIPHLKAAFQIGREERNSLRYSEMEVHSVEDEIQVQQCMYKILQPIPVDPNQSHTVRGPPNRHWKWCA